ncbi:polyketide cyclase [Streptomyces mashuensis]|uniref:Polyketide cyclase n=1 Tax=Streptomyces mashuensis TaxID=33904 RepID=A0A919B2S1_9ACTN|nr:SRPBCC family protein [Streptomyces mashuensis]GHF39506.1 polyketide cyclase [Streptomyces mashuensis]
MPPATTRPHRRTLHRYRFQGTWTFPAPPTAVYAVLEDADAYNVWWPQVRHVDRIDETRATVRVRSVLPYDLTLAVRATRHDPAAGLLEIAITGDLHGWARWTVRPHHPAGTTLRYDQEVEVRHPLMRLLALPGRPVFLANHAWMMRTARRSLRTRLDPARQGI